ncbi:MAG: hypothetical protein II400_02180 [Bacteroidaceae bacterium]|nr:hypothetical protein [Bacteroidaceae bacterium]
MRKLLLSFILLAVPLGLLAQGTTWETATAISQGGTGSGSLDKTVTDAWFKIEVPEEGTVLLTETPGGNLDIQVIDLCWQETVNKVTSRKATWYPGKKTGTLELTNAGKGTYYVHIHRSDGSGSFTLNYQFKACPFSNDAEPNDTEGLGDMLVSGSTVQGRLGYVDSNNKCDQDDWYKIQVEKDGMVQFVLNCNQDHELSIQVLEFFWCSSDTHNFFSRASKWYFSNDTLTVTDVGVGTYYVKLHRGGGHGGYKLKYIFTANSYANDVEPNDTSGSGTTLESGKIVEGHLGYRDGNDYRDNDDWYKLEVPQDGTVQLVVDCNRDFGLSLQKLDFVWYAASTSNYFSRASKWYISKDTLTITDVGVGTYYVNLHRGDGHGGYKLKYIFTANSYANDAEPNNEEGSGALLESGKTVDGHLGYSDSNDDRDIDDWYKVVVPQDGKVQLIVNCSQDYGLSLQYLDFIWYYSEQNSYRSRAAKWYFSSDTLTVTDVAAGSYYVRLHRGNNHGGYKLKYIFTANRYGNDTEPNDEGGQGDVIANGQTMQGHLGYLNDNNDRDVRDWYKLDVEQDGKVQLILNCNQEFALGLQVMEFCWYDSEQQKFRTRASKWYFSNDTLTISDVGVGTYYIHVARGSGHGGYSLKYVFTPNYFRNDAEPNDEIAQVNKTIENNETVTGHLGYLDANDKRDNDDWFKINTSKLSAYMVINAVCDTASTLSFQYVELVTKKGEEVKTVTSSWYTKTVVLSVQEIDENAEYYVHLHRGDGNGGYALALGAVERLETSKVRVHYIGQNSTRLGIPSPFQVTIENIDSQPSGSFFLVIPASDDVKLLYAECPCDTGIVRYNMDDLGGVDTNCATFVVPNLDPYESYTFTMYAEGRVNNKNVPGGPKHLILSGTVIAVGAYVGTIAISMATDKVVEYLTEKANKKLMPEERLQDYARTYSLTMDQLREQKEKYNVVTHGIKTMAKNAGENVMKAVPGGAPLATTMGVVENVNGVAPSLRRWFFYTFGRAKAIDDALAEDVPVSTLDAKVGATRKVTSWDPNEMCGPIGYGEEGYIGETKNFNYRILFENKKEASAPAYRIRITDVLDENIFDVSSVRFGTTSHDGDNYNWKVNRNGNILTWDIEGIELPPNVNAPEGEGFVSFSVDLKPGLADGTKIKNKATIIFDYNEPIETNEYLNTLDLVAPTSRIRDVSVNGNVMTVTARGKDSGSGVGLYRYYYSTNGQDFILYTESNSEEFEFPIEAGKKADDYSFYIVAVDNVGNEQLVEPEHWNVLTGIETISTTGNSDGWMVTRLDGRVVASGKGTPLLNLPSGIYIVRQGNQARKVVVK